MTPKDCEHIAHLLFLAYTGEASPDQQESYPVGERGQTS